MSQLNLPHGTNQLKSVNTEKLKSKKTDMLRSRTNSIQAGESVESVLKKKGRLWWGGFAEK